MSHKKAKKNIPVLSDETDFHDLFGVSNDETRKKFSDIIDEKLTSKELNNAYKEKNDTQITPNSGKSHSNKSISPQSILDLHGYTAKEAEEKTIFFVKTAAKKGLHSLLIITGKGLHSGGEGVLRDVVEAIVIELKQQNVINSFKWEKKHKHKSGAIFVYLK